MFTQTKVQEKILSHFIRHLAIRSLGCPTVRLYVKMTFVIKDMFVKIQCHTFLIYQIITKCLILQSILGERNLK